MAVDCRRMKITQAEIENSGTEMYLHIELYPQPGAGGLSDYRTLCIQSDSVSLQEDGSNELKGILRAVKKPEINDPHDLVGHVVLFGREGNGKVRWLPSCDDSAARTFFELKRAAA